MVLVPVVLERLSQKKIMRWTNRIVAFKRREVSNAECTSESENERPVRKYCRTRKAKGIFVSSDVRDITRV